MPPVFAPNENVGRVCGQKNPVWQVRFQVCDRLATLNEIPVPSNLAAMAIAEQGRRRSVEFEQHFQARATLRWGLAGMVATQHISSSPNWWRVAITANCHSTRSHRARRHSLWLRRGSIDGIGN